tara:strand:- start:32 stop:1093 length:1062 start_codon:yes stop_codon:yes gene_type:complete
MINLKKFYKNKKILITGHTGFKGSWLAFVLHQFGAKVYGYSLKPNRNISNFEILNLSKHINNFFFDIRDEKKLDACIKKVKPDIIFHLAAQSLVKSSYQNPSYTIQTNINGTLNVLNSVLKYNNIGAVVIITSDKSYKNKEKITGYKETDELGGVDPYSASKASAEIVTHAFIKSYFNKRKKIGVATARAGNVIGGGDWSDDRIIPDFIKSIKNNNTFYLRFPNAVRPWQHVFDVIYGYLLLGKKMFKNQNFNGSWNFGPSKRNLLTVKQLINFIKKQINFDKRIIVKKQKDFHETKLLVLDSTKSKKKLFWKSKYSIKKSLIVTSEWYKNYLNNLNLEKISLKQFKAFFKND